MWLGRWVHFLRLFIISAMFLGAIILQQQGHEPCVLCLMQRALLAYLGVLLVLSLLGPRYDRWFGVLSLLGVALLLLLSGRHLWLIFVAKPGTGCLVNLGPPPAWWVRLWGDAHTCGQDTTSVLGLPLSLWVFLYAIMHGVCDWMRCISRRSA